MWRFAALAAVPCLVAMVYHAQEGSEIAKFQQQRENEWLRDQDARERNTKGSLWAHKKHVTEFESCSQNPPTIGDSKETRTSRPDVCERSRTSGVRKAWPGPHAVTQPRTTTASPAEVVTPEGIDACKQRARQVRMQLGADAGSLNG